MSHENDRVGLVDEQPFSPLLLEAASKAALTDSTVTGFDHADESPIEPSGTGTRIATPSSFAL